MCLFYHDISNSTCFITVLTKILLVQMKVAVAVACLLLFCASAAFALQCSGKPNNFPIWTGEPTFVKAVPNGKLFTLDNNVQPNINIVHVWGSPYQMGYAYGQLIGPQINDLLSEVMTYIEDQVMQYLTQLPPFLQRLVAGTKKLSYERCRISNVNARIRSRCCFAINLDIDQALHPRPLQRRNARDR